MALAFDDYFEDGVSGTSISFVSNAGNVAGTVANVANRVLIAALIGRTDLGTPTVMTWGGVTMTLIGHVLGGSVGDIWFYGLKGDGNVATGNQTLAAAWPNSGTATLHAWAFNGADTTTGWQHFTSNSGTSTTPAITITSSSGNFIVFGCMDDDASSGSVDSPGVTDARDGRFTGNYIGGHKAASATSTTGNITLGSSVAWEIAGVEVLSGAAPTADLTGTAASNINEGDVVTGGKTVILTLTGDTFVPAAGTPTLKAANTKGTTAADSGGGGGARTSNGTLTCSFPTSYTAVANDFAVMLVYSDQGSGSVPTDWFEVTGSPFGSSTPKLNVFYKLLVGGESAPATTISGSTTNMSHCAQMVIYTGIGNIGAVGTATAGTGTPMTAAAINTTADNSLVIFATGRGDNENAAGNSFGGSTTGVTEQLDGGTASGDDSQVSLSDKAFPTSGTSSGGGSCTTGATDPFVAVMIELKPSTPFDNARTAIRNGLDSAQSEAAGWDAKVKGNIPVANVVRTSDTVCTITLHAQADYDITATETITATIPASGLGSGNPIVATPTFTVASSGGTSISAPSLSHTYTGNATQVRARVTTGQVTHTYLGRAPKVNVLVSAGVRTHTYTGNAPNTTVGAMVAATVSHTYSPRTAQAKTGITVAQTTHTYTSRTPKVNAKVMPLRAQIAWTAQATQVRARVAVPFRTHVYTARQAAFSAAFNISPADHNYTARPVSVQLKAYYGESFHSYTPIAPKASASVMPAARTHTYTGQAAGLRAKINPPNNSHAYSVIAPQAKRSVGPAPATHHYNSVQPATLTGNAFAVPVTTHVYVGSPGELRAHVQALQAAHAYVPAAPNTKAVIRPVQIVHAYTGLVPDMITGAILHPPQVTHVYTGRNPQSGTQNVRVIPGHPLGRGRR